MSPRTRSLWVSMHRWSGIILGLLVVLIGVTGSLLVYEDELDTLLNPDLFRVEPGDVYLPYDAIVAAAAAVGPDHLQPGYLTRLDDSPSRPVVVTVQARRQRRGAGVHRGCRPGPWRLRLGGRGEGERAEEHLTSAAAARKSRAPRDTLAHDITRRAGQHHGNLYVRDRPGPAVAAASQRRRWQA